MALFRCGMGGKRKLTPTLIGEKNTRTNVGTVTFQWDIKNVTDKWRELTNDNFYPYVVSLGVISGWGGVLMLT